MNIELNGFRLELNVLAFRDSHWITLKLQPDANGATWSDARIEGRLDLCPRGAEIGFALQFTSDYATRLRLQASLLGQEQLFHLIPGNIHGDNNADHVAPGQFPCLTASKAPHKNFSPLWEFRADRSSHPVSILCCSRGAIGVSIDPYSDCPGHDDGFIRNGVFAGLPNSCGVSLGYGNDPLTFSEKTSWLPATADLTHGAKASGLIFAIPDTSRLAAHSIIRALHERHREVPTFENSDEIALRALADTFATVNWSPELQQYTNRKCYVPTDTTLNPWRAVVEIGWTGGSMMAYPFALAERIFPDLKMPKTSTQIFDEICAGFNPQSGFINDTCINRSTKNRPEGWNASDMNGWWSGFLPGTRDHHMSYTNAHAAFYLLRLAWVKRSAHEEVSHDWTKTALQVLDTAVSLQRTDGAFGYIFSSTDKRVTDWEGFAGCWFVPALVYAWKFTGKTDYLQSAARAMEYYAPFVRSLAAWGSPMDTYKSIDSEGNLAFLRAARLLHEFTHEDQYLEMLLDSAHYEYLWRYGFRSRPQCAPLKGSNWNCCGGTITSVSNPHLHPMGVVATDDLEYLAKITGDDYHQKRADDGMAWLKNTMELYPNVMGYGRYGLLSERSCPSDGLLAEKYSDTGNPSSTWWSYNAWAAASAMEALAERIRSRSNRG